MLLFFSVSCRWDKQVISIREARALPKSNSPEWRNKFICVEGKHFSRYATVYNHQYQYKKWHVAQQGYMFSE